MENQSSRIGKLFIIAFAGIMSIFCPSLKAQENAKLKFLVPAIIQGNDTIPFVQLPTFEVFGEGTPADQEAYKAYLKLKYNVLKVYPYARWAAAKFNEIRVKSESLSGRERRRYIKEEEKKAKDQFEAELRNLTYSQGKILIKLVDRETGKSSYELVKELRGSIRAFLWQGVARLFTADLKAKYDSLGEDQAIEQIVRGIERGEIR